MRSAVVIRRLSAVALAASLVFGGVAAADPDSNWVKVVDDESGQIYLKKGSVRIETYWPYYSFWVLRNDPASGRSQIAKYYVKCDERMHQLFFIENHAELDGRGKILNRGITGDTYVVSTPGTVPYEICEAMAVKDAEQHAGTVHLGAP